MDKNYLYIIPELGISKNILLRGRIARGGGRVVGLRGADGVEYVQTLVDLPENGHLLAEIRYTAESLERIRELLAAGRLAELLQKFAVAEIHRIHGKKACPGEACLRLEQALEFIDTDELLEITPENIRIRKKILDPTLRKRSKINHG